MDMVENASKGSKKAVIRNINEEHTDKFGDMALELLLELIKERK